MSDLIKVKASIFSLVVLAAWVRQLLRLRNRAPIRLARALTDRLVPGEVRSAPADFTARIVYCRTSRCRGCRRLVLYQLTRVALKRAGRVVKREINRELIHDLVRVTVDYATAATTQHGSITHYREKKTKTERENNAERWQRERVIMRTTKILKWTI